MAYGKIKADALIHDNGGSDVEVAISSIAGKADTASPTFTGTPAAPTAASGTNTTQIATTAFVTAAVPDISGKANTSDIGSTIQAFDADTAKTDVAQTYTAGQRGEVTTVTSSNGGLNINFPDSNNFYIELSENITSVTFASSNTSIGQSGSIFIKQPASGGTYAVGGWTAGWKFSGGAAPTITAVNDKCDRVDYVVRANADIQVVWTGNY